MTIPTNDLIADCNTVRDKRGKPFSVQEFEAGFCLFCRNPTCVRAKWVADLFSARISTQMERFFDTVQVTTDLPRYAHIPQFPDLSKQAEAIECWEVPEIPIEDGKQEKAPDEISQSIIEAAQSLKRPTEAPQAPPEPILIVPPTGNTIVPNGGIIIGPGPSMPDPVNLDPWAPPPPKGDVVEVGGTVKMGGGNDTD